MVGSPSWHALVAETQFAIELTETGLRRLCVVPTEVDPDRWVGDDRNFALYVGMHSYAAGLERLAKLTIACHGFLQTGSFKSTRKYVHKIDDLLDAVDALNVTTSFGEDLPTRPDDAVTLGLTRLTHNYAGGAGRYEYLDSLSNKDTEVAVYRSWVRLSRQTTVPDEILHVISVQRAAAEAVGAELSHAGLETCGDAAMKELDQEPDRGSVGAALGLFRTARWVSSVLDATTYYTHQSLPILNEALYRLKGSSYAFYAYQIARLSDVSVVEEELEEALPRIYERNRIEEEEGFTEPSA